MESTVSRRTENAGFGCLNCGQTVRRSTDGSYRNHCPFCLWSRHVDLRPGDRAAVCGAPMAPVALRDRPGKGWQIVHRCTACGVVRANRVTRDGNQPDDVDALIALMGGSP